MNLEKLNLVELNAQEVKQIEGGILPWVASAALWVIDNWDDIVAGHERYKKKHNL
ncbi:class IIb bacteriocin, lactobin A/cerein 7B family [Elizabethkingia anophelis]|uniref:class IIb bacteriocin, lactobin A/cerein 7B family n=1 Tax=Elizabethkingia anophelis TaxID=1117645 RepID=UPI00099AC0C7|nr:class IIb bacteriocin, lactobin A/cerein 7B family [Elizabethkingia anophelis]MCT4013726.1 class IIb bacteriocin, lactobin A/cerein 7B family [Elizabethkingia anophelis]MDV3899508.1 class IIb bacteriocin, lactobin A/cerein 7B family [Elizabethkingia anophelis]